jgi:hypothetical protein
MASGDHRGKRPYDGSSHRGPCPTPTRQARMDDPLSRASSVFGWVFNLHRCSLGLDCCWDTDFLLLFGLGLPQRWWSSQLLMTNFGMSGKTRLFGLGNWSIRFFSFRTRSNKRLNLKIRRSRSIWSLEKRMKDIKEPTMCWRPNLTFWENQSVLFAKLKHLVFIMIRWSIFLNGGQLYIFHKLYHTRKFLGYAHVSWAIWLNFTQETKMFFKLQEVELKLKIWNLHDEALIEAMKMDRWNTWFCVTSRNSHFGMWTIFPTRNLKFPKEFIYFNTKW